MKFFKKNNYSWFRLWAIIVKEFIQIKRDRPTLAMMLGIPLLQLILFGYAINTNPKYLPSVVISADNSVFTRSFIKALENTKYFRFEKNVKTEKAAKDLMAKGDVQFIVYIPPKFSKDLIRGNRPSILVEADATDPVSTGNAVGAINTLARTAFNRDLTGPLESLRPRPPPVNVVVHAKYNPLAITQYNIIPGLLGVVLTLTMAFITALAMTRERERGTMENLLVTPVKPIEIMIGKIAPYIIIGYCQVLLILSAAYYLFHVPIEGNIFLLLAACLPFIAANLTMGLTFSTLAKNQLQAIQGAMFFFLPSILLSGFMFPFRGMPHWAQAIGNLLPLTHFVVIVRGILLKGNGFFYIWPEVWPILLFTLVVISIGIKRFRKTLD